MTEVACGYEVIIQLNSQVKSGLLDTIFLTCKLQDAEDKFFSFETFYLRSARELVNISKLLIMLLKNVTNNVERAT